MPATKTPHSSVAVRARGAWLLLVMALPFLGVGLFAFGRAVSLLQAWRETRHWARAEAHISSVELTLHDADEGGPTYQTRCTYTYTYGGRTYRGDRVGLEPGADNIGSWQQERYAYLKGQHERGEPVPCLVDPRDPRRAVLFAELRVAILVLWGSFALTFTTGGAGLAATGLWMVRSRRNLRRARELHPDQPWLWRPEWAGGVVRAGGRGQRIMLWGMCLFWNAVSWGVCAPLLTNLAEGMWPSSLLIFLLFPAIGLVMLGGAVYVTIRQVRFGRSTLRLESAPVLIGGRLRAELVLRGATRHVQDVHLRLTCLRSVVKTGGEDSARTETVLWSAERIQPADRLWSDERSLSVPVDFAIPADCRPWDDANSNDKVEWKLKVSADVPGVNLKLEFPVPVFAP